jgi:hypothetical protein
MFLGKWSNLSTIALMLEKQSRGVDESVNQGINRVSTLEGCQLPHF